jgi:hypothetical protein
MPRSICEARDICCRWAINKVARLLAIQHWQASGTPPHRGPCHPAVLIPYSVSVTLTLNASGHVTGTSGTSGEAAAQLYQELSHSGIFNEYESATITVP